MMPHTPVMLDEVVSYFDGKKIKVFFDGTLGAGGHAEAILQAHPEIETYIGCDQDPAALAIASERLQPWKEKLKLFHGNSSELDKMVASLGIKHVDGFFLI